MSVQEEIRTRITDTILDALKKGTAPWRRPWGGGVNTGAPANVISKKAYRGINHLLLNCSPFDSRWYATYRQWQGTGAQVRRGQHGARIVFWKPVEKEVRKDNGEVEEEKFLVMREYTVFNAEQVDGAEKFLAQHVTNNGKAFVDFTPAETAIQATNASITFGGNRAFYRPAEDAIHLPHKATFVGEHEFYAVAFHELSHWTGHENRLARLDKDARFGSASYAFEELVAEMAGCFLCTEIGVPQSDDMTNHNAYLQSWLDALKNNHGAIISASSQASKAADFILAFSRKPEEATEEAALAGSVE